MCPNSTSTGAFMRETAGFLLSVGCRLTPVIEASKNRTPTPFGGVSRIDKLTGTPFPAGEDFMEPPQAAIKTQHATTSANESIRLMAGPRALDCGLGRRGRWVSLVLALGSGVLARTGE